ncbi:ribonuclease III [Patescibacteria group bacterium]|nr:ribonuclease III [Patescibacteria group bacterium]MCL5409950.1 ribonuclease III [Patescibacteria group bacterium]
MSANLDEFRQILEKLGLTPTKNPCYQTAFIHRSYLNEAKNISKSNERLEFLGDSVLSLIVSTDLYQSHPQDEEGELTNLRAFVVKTDSLAKVARNLGLGKFLMLSKGEELSDGRNNTQILANTYESVLGAVYLDLGLNSARKFVESTLLSFFREEVEKGAPKDPKSQLQEVAQNILQSAPKYKILQTSGPDHAKHFTVGVFLQGHQAGEGSGPSKQQAEEMAAQQALEYLAQQSKS